MDRVSRRASKESSAKVASTEVGGRRWYDLERADRRSWYGPGKRSPSKRASLPPSLRQRRKRRGGTSIRLHASQTSTLPRSPRDDDGGEVGGITRGVVRRQL